MKRVISAFALAALLAAPLFAPARAAEDPLAAVLKREGYAVSLDLKVKKKKRGSLPRLFDLLDGEPPNAYATGFVVGDGLVMTAYHVVSGDLSPDKRRQLGFSADEPLSVSAYVNDCEATLLTVDPGADLALLRVCGGGPKRTAAPAFQAETGPVQDEKLLVIARPNGFKSVKRGVFSGTYNYHGRQYWAATIEGRDGFSGSPVYNDRGEIVGVFSGYDWTRKVSLISPGARAQKLLEDYASAHKP
ncbi:MAG TPA: serine protease [Pyrinomonadaceae bacterium]|nr:serine protease [Pyrinomonadaceae bacterium]